MTDENKCVIADAARFATAFSDGWVPFLQEDTDRLVAVLRSIAKPAEPPQTWRWWRLVPIEPTDEWVRNFESIKEHQAHAREIISEVLAAAPIHSQAKDKS